MVETSNKKNDSNCSKKNVVKFKAGAELEGAVNHYIHFL
jgi:nucleoid DNA-binding protein